SPIARNRRLGSGIAAFGCRSWGVEKLALADWIRRRVAARFVAPRFQRSFPPLIRGGDGAQQSWTEREMAASPSFHQPSPTLGPFPVPACRLPLAGPPRCQVPKER